MSELENAAGAAAPARDGGRLHKGLSSFGVLLLTLSCLSPVFSIYGVGADVLAHAGSGAVLLFLIGVAAAVIWAAVYAELGSAFPYAGGDYVGVGHVLGGWAGAVTLVMWAVTAGPACAFEAKIIADYAGGLAPGVPPWAFTYGSVALAVLISILAVRSGAVITSLFLGVEVLAVLVLLGAGLLHPVRGVGQVLAHPLALTPSGVMAPVSFAAFSLAAISAVYGTVGGNQALYFGEELSDPHRRMGRVVVLACMSGALAIALTVIVVVLGAPDLPALLRSSTPFAAFISGAIGPWAGYALSVGVALAIFNAMTVQVMASSRLFFSLGRDGLFPASVNRLLSGVDARSGSPRAATLAVGAFTAACCLLPSHTLLVFISGLLVYAWSLVCLAVLIGRRKGLTGIPGYWRAPLHPLAPLLGLVMAAVFTVADLADADSGRPSLILLGAIALTAVLWHRFVLRKRGWKPSLEA